MTGRIGARLGALLLGGCVTPGPFGDHGAPPEDIVAPTLSGWSIDCEVDAGVWSLAFDATSWTGGAVTVWTNDLVYIERHAVLATASAPDGTSEHLAATLPIVKDWRDQAPNVSTVFTCADAPSIALTLLDVDGAIVDCRFVGPLADDLAALPSVHCPAR